MVQEIRSLQKLAIFFRVSRWGRRGGGLYAVLYGTLKLLSYTYKVTKPNYMLYCRGLWHCTSLGLCSTAHASLPKSLASEFLSQRTGVRLSGRKLAWLHYSTSHSSLPREGCISLLLLFFFELKYNQLLSFFFITSFVDVGCLGLFLQCSHSCETRYWLLVAEK